MELVDHRTACRGRHGPGNTSSTRSSLAMSSQGAATRPHPRARTSRRSSTNSQPSRRLGADAKTSTINMDLDSIRTRRARLQALTASIRLPPLTPIDALGTRRSPVYDRTPHRGLPSGERRLRIRPKANLPTSAASVRAQSEGAKLPALSLPPMTSPYHNPLPEIGHAREQAERKAEDEKHLDYTRIESPPPPTYEETQNVHQLVEEISQEARVETSPPLNSPDSQEPSSASLATAAEDPTRPTSATEERPETAKPAVVESEDENETAKSPVVESDVSETEDEADFIKIVSDMGSKDLEMQLKATFMARKFLCRTTDPPIDEFLHADILTPALDNLHKENDILLFETVWVITNIASGSSAQTNALVDRGFIEPLVRLLKSSKANVQEQVTWALGNIAGDGPELRNKVVAAGIVKPLVALVTQDIALSFLRNLTWAFSNIFRTKNLEMPDEEKSLFLHILKENLLPHDDSEVHVDALWTLEYYTAMGNGYIQQVLDAGIIPLLIDNLHSSSVQVLSPALRAVCNIFSGTDAQTDAVLSAEVLPNLLCLLTNYKPEIRKQTVWGLSNILAGTHSQIQMVIDAGIIPVLAEMAEEDEFNVQKEIIWGLANMAGGGSRAQIEVLLSSGGLQLLVPAVLKYDTGLIVSVTNGIRTILKELDGDNSVKLEIEECGGLQIMKDNLYHENTDVRANIAEILSYFQESDEENSTKNQEKEQVLPEKASKYVADLTEA